MKRVRSDTDFLGFEEKGAEFAKANKVANEFHMADKIFKNRPKRASSSAVDITEDEDLDDSLREDDQNVADEAAADDLPAPIRYAITSFGADFDIEGVVKRLNREEILIPPFQRGYIWTIKEASRFIESLLLGLPVPGVFLAREEATNKFLVIDGQQRLKTLQFFFSGFFNPRPGEASQKVFQLVDVQKEFSGRTYAKLEEKDRRQLNDSILHATIVKQDVPENENTSIYHIFERLNSGGRRLAPQEIRTAIYHGALVDLLQLLNREGTWRDIYGKPSPRLKDQELILRFFALLHDASKYQRPMNEFLNQFAATHRFIEPLFAKEWRKVFLDTSAAISTALDGRAFRPERSLNAAVFDSVMVGTAKRLEKGPINRPKALADAYDTLLKDPTYLEVTSRSTADEKFVNDRLQKATSAFAGVE